MLVPHTYPYFAKEREDETHTPSILSALRKHANDLFTTRSNLGPRHIKGIVTVAHKLSTIGVEIELEMSAFALSVLR